MVRGIAEASPVTFLSAYAGYSLGVPGITSKHSFLPQVPSFAVYTLAVTSDL